MGQVLGSGLPSSSFPLLPCIFGCYRKYSLGKGKKQQQKKKQENHEKQPLLSFLSLQIIDLFPLHFTEEETEGLSGHMTGIRPFSWSVAELELEPRVVAPKPEDFSFLHRPHLANATVWLCPLVPQTRGELAKSSQLA